jgi:hypothetical protein
VVAEEADDGVEKSILLDPLLGGRTRVTGRVPLVFFFDCGVDEGGVELFCLPLLMAVTGSNAGFELLCCGGNE